MRISDWSSDVCSAGLGDPLLGRLVEFAAPGPDHQPAGRIEDGSEHAAAAVGDGDRHAPVVRRLAAGARARRQSVARGRQGLGAQAGRGAAMSYQNYVIAAYLGFAVVLLWDYVAPRTRIRPLLRGPLLLAAPPRRAPGREEVVQDE